MQLSLTICFFIQGLKKAYLSYILISLSYLYPYRFTDSYVYSLLLLRLGIRDVVDNYFSSTLLFNCGVIDVDNVHPVSVYGHIMLKAPVLVRSLQLSNIESR